MLSGWCEKYYGESFLLAIRNSKPPKIGTISEDLRESSVLSVWLIFLYTYISTLAERCLNLLKQCYKPKCLLYSAWSLSLSEDHGVYEQPFYEGGSNVTSGIPDK